MSDGSKLGMLLDETAQRDAIHVAIAPVVAAHILAPGEHVGFIGGDDEFRDRVGRVTDKIGIVDPFLREPVLPGQRFWLCLYQQSITSLRHQWTHPAFEDLEAALAAALARSDASKATSEGWLRTFCSTANCPGYETVMSAIKGEDTSYDNDYSYSRIDTEYFHFGGQDAGGEIPDEFWTHVEIVLGHCVQYKPRRFSCSC